MVIIKKPIKKPIQHKPRTTLTIKQRRFVDEVVKSWNATEAASKVYKTKNRTTACSVWNENLRKPLIKASIEERVKICKDVIYWIATKEDEKSEVRIKAAQDVIDRIEWKALARTEHSGKLTILSEEELLD